MVSQRSLEAELRGSAKRSIFVVSGPSGCGKTTVSERVVRQLGIRRSISHTTRPVRPGEVEGEDYFFVSREEFVKGIERGDYVEHTEYLGNLYGTPRGPMEEATRRGERILLDIDVQGGAQVKKLFPQAVLIFLAPPNDEVLRERLSGRGTESGADVAMRLARARAEMEQKADYEHVVVNDDLAQAVEEVKTIITSAGGK